MVDDIDKEVEDIKKLPARERLERLRALAEREEKRKKVAENALRDAETAVIDQELLNTPEGTEITDVLKQEEGLEDVATPETPPTIDDSRVEYFRQLDYRGLQQQFDALTSTLRVEGSLTSEQLTDLYTVAEEARTRRAAIEEGSYKPVGEQVASQLKDIETTWEKIRKNYI